MTVVDFYSLVFHYLPANSEPLYWCTRYRVANKFSGPIYDGRRGGSEREVDVPAVGLNLFVGGQQQLGQSRHCGLEILGDHGEGIGIPARPAAAALRRASLRPKATGSQSGLCPMHTK